MKAKYVFTKYGSRRNELELSAVIPETDPDYDVADVFLTDKYSDDGESWSIEAENLEEAVYFANKYFRTCASPKNIAFSYECWDKISEKAYELQDPFFLDIVHCSALTDAVPYIPAPVKIDDNFGTYFNKRYRKYYQNNTKRNAFGPDSLVFDYSTVYDRM